MCYYGLRFFRIKITNQQKLSKTRISKMVQFGDFLGPLTKVALSLKKNVLLSLVKSLLMSWGLTAAASATDAATQKKIFGSIMTTLVILNKEMKNIMKTVKSLIKPGLLLKSVIKNLKMKQKNKKVDISACH